MAGFVCGSLPHRNREELDRAEWLAPLTQNIRFVLKDCEQLLKQALAVTQQDDGPDMYEKAVQAIWKKYESLSKLTSFCELSVALSDIKYDRLASSRGFEGDPDKLELVKSLREQAKDVVKKALQTIFFLFAGDDDRTVRAHGADVRGGCPSHKAVCR